MPDTLSGMRRLVPADVQRLADNGSARDSSTGAALIIDAAGSTALSARLQAYGTEGAEAFADVLSAIFQPIVRRVVARGGTVAELAGDGVLATFPGQPETAVGDAGAAAAEVMRDLQSLQELETPAGKSSLTVRASVGAGSIEWVIWSSINIDGPQNAAYAVVGTAVDEARRGEAVTPAGVISAGPNAAPHAHSSHSEPLADGFTAMTPLLDLPPRATESTTGEGSFAGGLRFYPEEVTKAELRAEFRDVVAVFADFTAPSSSRAEARMAQVLDALAEYRGYLSSVTKPSADDDGFRCFALWGAPTSREHDIGYALRFLQDLKEACGTEMRAGITRSTVFTGFLGGSEQESYTAIGPGVNLAARLCGSAEWGELRIDSESTSRLRDPWVVESLGEIEYRGFSDPVATAKVSYVPPVRVADPLDDSLVGRSRELDKLEDMLAPLWAGRSAGVIAVSGEPGIGKSRLIAALEERISVREPAPVWLRARADEIRSQPLATLRDALAGYFGRPGRDESGEQLDIYLKGLAEDAQRPGPELSRTRAALGDLLDLAPEVERAEKLDPKTRFENLVIAVENLVGALERTTPVIVFVADGHWIDAGTADVLRRLSDDLKDRRIGIVVETRDPHLSIEHDRHLELGPLGEADLVALATQILGNTPDPEKIRDLMRLSGGNPFYAQQFLAHQHPGTATASLPSGTDDDLPLDLRRLLVARIDAMPATVRRIVQTGSVLGREVDVALLELMSPAAGDIGQQVQAAIDAGIWERIDNSRVTFQSLLVRDAAYGMLLHTDARAMHREAASAIESRLEPGERRDAELAHHHERAGNSQTATSFYLAAGELAADRFDNTSAHDHIARALSLIPEEDRDRRYQALRLRYRVHDVEGDRQGQEETIASMGQLAKGTGSAFDVAQLHVRLLIALGRYRDAEQRAGEASVLASGPAEQGRLAFLQAQLARYLGRNDDAAKLAATSRDLLAAADDNVVTAMVDDFAGGIAWENGDFEHAAALHRAAADIFESEGRVIEGTRALNNLGTALFSIGDYSSAREIHRAGANLSGEIGYRMGEGDHLDNMGGTAWAVGDLDLALDYYSEALRIREKTNDAWGVAISKGNLGSTKRAMGDHEEAIDLYRQALEIDRSIGRPRGEAYDLHGLGLCHIDLEHFNLANEALREAARIREELGETHLANESHVACAITMLRAGDTDGAVEIVETVLASEGDSFFDGAVETTAARLRAIEVIEARSPERARALRETTAQGVVERAARISDAAQRQSYLERVASHATALSDS